MTKPFHLPGLPGEEVQLLDQDAARALKDGILNIAEKHKIPFHILGPCLVAMGDAFRQQWAESMVKRQGRSVEDAQAYLQHTKAVAMDLDKGNDRRS